MRLDAFGRNGRDVPNIEDLVERSNAAVKRNNTSPKPLHIAPFLPFLSEILEIAQSGDTILNWNAFQRKHKVVKSKLLVYQMMMVLLCAREGSRGDTGDSGANLETLSRVSRALGLGKNGESGVAPITLVTSPTPTYTDSHGSTIKQEFTCAHNCHFCPKEVDSDGKPTQPRSYLSNEPAMLRALSCEFDALKQTWERMAALINQGVLVEKMDVNIIGGTFLSYPKEYLEEFVRDVFYAANTFQYSWSDSGVSSRPRLSLQEEKKLNETAKCRVVLIAVEIRPDSVTPDELRFLRRLGVTRIQLGIQHIDDSILDRLNRRCSTLRTKQSIRMLKDCGFKVDGHFMPNLPGSSPESDRNMLINELVGLSCPIKRTYPSSQCREPFEPFESCEEIWEEYVLFNPDIQCDQLKIYPTAVTVFTEIEKWFVDGTYVPYDENDLVDILLTFKALVFPWVRINRIMRDFHTVNVYSISGSNLAMRGQLSNMLNRDGVSCKCIRCREVRGGCAERPDLDALVTVVSKYFASGGQEYWISSESRSRKVLYGFVRLRFAGNEGVTVFPELYGAALIRETHVYSYSAGFSNASGGREGNIQHRGIGTALVRKAESIASANGYKKIAVIAAVGSRGYFEGLGYEMAQGDGEFMTRRLVYSAGQK